MADTAISALPAATSVATTDILPCVESATTKKVTVALILGAAGTTANYVLKANSGGTAIETGLLANANIDAAAGIVVSKLEAGTNNRVVRSNGTTCSFAQVALTTDVTGTLPVANGGTGITSFGAGVATFLGTPSGANLASALTTTIPGTALTAAGGGAAGSMSGADKTKLDGIQTQGSAVAVGAMAIDWAAGTVFTKTLAAGANTFTFSNAASGMVIIVRVTGATSTLTWPTVRWAGGVAPTQTSAGTDVYTFVHDGTNIYGSVVQDMA